MRNPVRFASALLLMAFLAASPSFAETRQAKAPAQDAAKTQDVPPADPYLDLATAQIGRALFLRCLCFADTLEFNANGTLESARNKPADWTLAGIDIKKIERKGLESIEFQGYRVAIRWNDDAKEFNRHPLKLEPVKVVINGATTPEALKHALAAVFSTGIDRAFQLSMPPYWQHYFDPHAPWADQAMKNVPIYIPGDKVNNETVVAPKLLNKPSLSYTPEAAQDKVNGSVVLRVVVDATGAQHHLSIYQPLGYGLDARSVEAVEKIKFAPSVLAGKPGASVMLLRQDFDLAVVQPGDIQ